MIGLLFLLCLSKSLVIIPNQAGDKVDVAIIMIHGQGCKVETYQNLFNQVQEQTFQDGFRLWVGIPQFIFDTPEPVLIDHYVQSSLDELRQQGFQGDNVYIAGHSLGGVMSQMYVKTNTQFKGLILMGSALMRKYVSIEENGKSKIDFPVKVLTIGGTKDGLFRVSRMAEYFYHSNKNINDYQMNTFPTIVKEGLSHQSFMSQQYMTDFVQKNDITPDISEQEGYGFIAESISSFLLDNTKQLVHNSQDVLYPLLEAMILEGSYNIKPPCYDSTLVNQLKNTCLQGSYWTQVAQKIMGGNKNQLIDTQDNFHRVYSVIPVHLPQINNTCNASDCTLETITVTENIYETLEIFDTGFYPIAATEMKAKLMSRQSIQRKSGISNANFHKLDEEGNNCAEINQQSLDWALKTASKQAIDNYNKFGNKLVIGDDMGPYNAGPLWIWKYLSFTSKNNQTIVQSPMMRTPDDYFISSAAGFHYCKLLSPFRAMEWIYIDSLKN